MKINIKEQDIKMRVTPEQSKQVQEICFDLGIYWGDATYGYIKFEDKPYIFIEGTAYKRGYRVSCIYTIEPRLFTMSTNKEVSAEEFIQTKGFTEMDNKIIDLENSEDKVYYCHATKKNFDLLKIKLKNGNGTGFQSFSDMLANYNYGDGNGDFLLIRNGCFTWEITSKVSEEDYQEITSKLMEFYLVQENTNSKEIKQTKPKEPKKDKTKDKNKDVSKKILKKFIKRIKKEQKNKIYSEVTTYNKCADILKDIVLEVGKRKKKVKGE